MVCWGVWIEVIEMLCRRNFISLAISDRVEMQHSGVDTLPEGGQLFLAFFAPIPSGLT